MASKVSSTRVNAYPSLSPHVTSWNICDQSPSKMAGGVLALAGVLPAVCPDCARDANAFPQGERKQEIGAVTSLITAENLMS